MHLAEERQHVVLAQRMELDVAHQHHAVAFGVEDAASDHVLGLGFVARGEEAHRAGEALRRVRKARALRILAEVLEHRPRVRGKRIGKGLDRHVHQRVSPARRCITRATMRSQRSPAKPKASSHARSTSEARPSRSRLRARKNLERTVAFGNLQDVGGLFDRVLLHRAQHEHRAVGPGQRVDALLEQLSHLGATRRTLRLLVHAAFRNLVDLLHRHAGLQRDDGAAPRLLPQAHQRLVRHHASEPGREARLASVAADGAVGLQIRLLQRVFRFGVVAQDRPRGAKERPVVPAHHRFKRRPVAAGHRPGELGIGGLGIAGAR